MGKVLKPIARLAPIAATLTGNPELALALGAGGGLLSGGGLKGALLGGATGYLGAGGASSLLGAGGALDTGLTGAGLKAASGALTGAVGGNYLGGNLSSTLLGAGLGGLGGYVQGSGGVGNALDNAESGIGSAYDSLTGAGSSAADATSLAGSGAASTSPVFSGAANGLGGAGESTGSGLGSISGTNGGTGLATGGGSSAYLDPTNSTSNIFGSNGGISGAAGVGTATAPSAITAATSANNGGIFSGLTSGLGNSSAIPLISGGVGLIQNQAAQDALVNSQKQSQAELAPYLASGQANNAKLSELLGTGGDSTAADYGQLAKPFDPSSITSDPGYQFELQQGNQALDRQDSAKGQYFSGAALKGAEDYGTGLANETLNDYYNRYEQNNQQLYNQYAGQSGAGQSAATAGANINTNTGNAEAAGDISTGNLLAQSLSGLLKGSGAAVTNTQNKNGLQILGLDANGKPIYGNSTASSF